MNYVSPGGIEWEELIIHAIHDKHDRELHASSFPDAIGISPELLEQADNRWLNTNDECITFTLSNGVGRYRVAEIDRSWSREILICTKISSSIVLEDSG